MTDKQTIKEWIQHAMDNPEDANPEGITLDIMDLLKPTRVKSFKFLVGNIGQICDHLQTILAWWAGVRGLSRKNEDRIQM